MNGRLVSAAVIVWSLGATAACSPPASQDPVGANPDTANTSTGNHAGANWDTHGSTACAEYITPDFAGQIFDNAAGENRKDSAASCSFHSAVGSNIYIALIIAGAATFDADPNAQGAAPVSGIGDKAVRTATGIEAYKAHHGICQIDVTPPLGLKLDGEALAQKLGDVCNKLFALQ